MRARLDALCTGHYDALLDDYRRRCTVLGRPVAIHEDAPEGREVARGRVAGITDDLALRLDGREEPVRGGRLIEIQDAANGW